MKNTFTKLLSLVLALVLCLGMFAACGNDNKTTDPTETDEPDDLLGITDDTIWVGNTAGTTGATEPTWPTEATKEEEDSVVRLLMISMLLSATAVFC